MKHIKTVSTSMPKKAYVQANPLLVLLVNFFGLFMPNFAGTGSTEYCQFFHDMGKTVDACQ